MPSLTLQPKDQRIRVQVKETGQIGNVPANRFDESRYERLEEEKDDKFQLRDLLPVGGAILGGAVGGIPGFALGAGAGRLLERGYSASQGEDIKTSEAFKQAGKEALISGAVGGGLKLAGKVAGPALRLAKTGVQKFIPFMSEVLFGPNVTRKTLPLIFKNPKLAKAMTGEKAFGSIVTEAKHLTESSGKKLTEKFITLRNQALKAKPKAVVDLVPVRKVVVDEVSKLSTSGLPPATQKGIITASKKLFPTKTSLSGERALKLREFIDEIYKRSSDNPVYRGMLQNTRTALQQQIQKTYQGTTFSEADKLYTTHIDDIDFLKRYFIADKGQRADAIIKKLTPKFRKEITPQEESFLNELLERVERFSGTSKLSNMLKLYAATAVEREPIKGLVGQPFIGTSQIGARLMIKGTRAAGRLSEKGISLGKALKPRDGFLGGNVLLPKSPKPISPVARKEFIKEIIHNPSFHQFYSPNKGNLNYKEALKQMKSPDHKLFKDITDDLHGIFKVKAKSRIALGAFTDGPENSIHAEIRNLPLSTSRVLAALKGKIGQQKSVLNFMEQKGGPDTLYKFQVSSKHGITEIKNILHKNGLTYPTITEDNMVIFSGDDAAKELVKKSMKQLGSKQLVVRKGIAEFIGDSEKTFSNTREEALKQYNKIIQEFITSQR